MTHTDTPLVVAGRTLKSRLIIGTGKYKSYAQNAEALVASGAEMITVALRRVNLSDPSQERLVDHIDPKQYIFLPNTAGCFTGEDAVRTLRLAREAGGWDLVKLEVLSDPKHLYPDMEETLRATDMLVKDGFDVMVYCSDDPVYAKKLEEAGACAIMPLGAPIGSGLGVQNPVNIRLIIEEAGVPVIVRCRGRHGLGRGWWPWSWGCDGVLMNTAIAEAQDPIPHGQCHEACGDCRTRSLSGGSHGEKALCRSVQPASRFDLERSFLSRPGSSKATHSGYRPLGPDVSAWAPRTSRGMTACHPAAARALSSARCMRSRSAPGMISSPMMKKGVPVIPTFWATARTSSR